MKWMKAFEFLKSKILKGLQATTVRQRLALAMALLMAASISVFLVFLYSFQHRAILDGVDARLETAARMAQALLPQNYHSRIAGRSSVSDQEYQAIVDRHNRLCRSLRLEYLWSVMFQDGKVVFTTATSPDKEPPNGKYAGFLEVHFHPELYTTALNRRAKTFQNSQDRWGDLRMALIPFQDQKGRTYLMAAGMRRSEVDGALDHLIHECLGAGLWLFLISIAGIHLLAGILAKPVERLTETIKAIAAGDITRQAPENGAREHVELARCFNRLNQSIQRQITELTLERENLRITLQSIGDGVIVTDATGRVTLMNPVAERLTGWPLAEALGRPLVEVFRIVNAQTRQPADDPVARVLKTGLVIGLANHTALIARDGTESQIADSAASIRDEKDHVFGVVMVFSDVTKDYAMREAVREAEERLRLLFERMISGCALHEIICDASGKPVDYRFLEVNPAFEQLTGFKAAGILGRTVREVMPRVESEWIDRYGRVALTGESDHFDHYAVEMNKYFSVAAYSPKPGQFAAIFNDITIAKRAEAALVESEARFRGFYELGLIGMWITTPDKGFTMFNDRVCEILGWSRQELANKTWAEITHPEDLAPNQRLFERALSGELEGYSMDKRFICGNGDVVYTSISVRCLRKPDGSLNYFAGMIQDISDRKRNEQVLKDSLREKEALLKEVHHRVKNNLQIVSSLLRLQSAQIDDPIARNVLRDMQNRIRTMALLHENLYRSENLAQVNLAVYFQSICAQLLRSMMAQPELVKLELDVAPVSLEVSQAVPCGLLLNELVSNCLKHAFPQSRTGVVRVELQPVPDGRALRLRVSDNGVGLAPGFDPRNLRTLGLQLVSDLARQLQGELKIESDKGAVFEVNFIPSGGYTISAANE
jgi:PAS domain S-box-containing protein